MRYPGRVTGNVNFLHTYEAGDEADHDHTGGSAPGLCGGPGYSPTGDRTYVRLPNGLSMVDRYGAGSGSGPASTRPSASSHNAVRASDNRACQAPPSARCRRTASRAADAANHPVAWSSAWAGRGEVSSPGTTGKAIPVASWTRLSKPRRAAHGPV